MSKYDEIHSKRYVICSMLSIGWILIYDIIDIIISIFAIQNIEEFLLIVYNYFFAEILSILYLIKLFAINKDLSKADNPDKYKENKNWFYENKENRNNEDD